MPTLKQLRGILRAGESPALEYCLPVPEGSLCLVCEGGRVSTLVRETSGRVRSGGHVDCPNCVRPSKEWPGLREAALGGECVLARSVADLAALIRHQPEEGPKRALLSVEETGDFAVLYQQKLGVINTWQLLHEHGVPALRVGPEHLLAIGPGGIIVYRPSEPGVYHDVDECVHANTARMGDLAHEAIGLKLRRPGSNTVWNTADDSVWNRGLHGKWKREAPIRTKRGPKYTPPSPTTVKKVLKSVNKTAKARLKKGLDA